MKSMQNSRSKPDNSESGSSNGGNNSDNSALVSLGNTSFGFNFDSEESNSKEGQNDSNDDSDGNVRTREKKGDAAPVKKRSSVGHPSIVTSSTSISSSNHSSLPGNNNSAEQVQAAAHAVASLESLAARSYPIQKEPFTEADNAQAQREALDRKRNAAVANDNKDADSGGYNTDDEEAPSTSHRSTGTATKSSRKKMRRDDDDTKREERNQREKERSFRISKQITELRDLLASGGVVVPKGTKSSVLTEAASYIRMLQQHQYRSEM
jgi:Helix-loop-helix DNA-binding domain